MLSSNQHDVVVRAEVRQAENFIGYTIQNRSSDTVFLDNSPRTPQLQRLEDGEWRFLGPDSPVIDVLNVVSIGPGDEFPTGTQFDGRLLPGEYRYGLSLYEDYGLSRPLAKEARISNVVRIE